MLYASTQIPNPNSAYYDWKLECVDCTGCNFFVDWQDLQIVQIPVEDGKQKHQVNESGTEVVHSTLYVVAEGVEENTTFAIETAFGDTSTPKGMQFCGSVKPNHNLHSNFSYSYGSYIVTYCMGGSSTISSCTIHKAIFIFSSQASSPRYHICAVDHRHCYSISDIVSVAVHFLLLYLRYSACGIILAYPVKSKSHRSTCKICTIHIP